MNFDFTRQRVLMPHPVYGWMNWVCMLNPTETEFERLKGLIDEAYGLAVHKGARRK